MVLFGTELRLQILWRELPIT